MANLRSIFRMKRKLLVFDSIHDVLQKEKERRKDGKKERWKDGKKER